MFTRVWPKRNKSTAQRLLPFESFCIHFSNDNSLYPPSIHAPQGWFIEKKPPYMVIVLPHRQLAFLGTLFKEDPPQGFYIALVFLPKTPRPSVPGRRTSHTLGEYCLASAASSFLGLSGLLFICAPPDLLGFCGPGHRSRTLVVVVPGTHCYLLGKGISDQGASWRQNSLGGDRPGHNSCSLHLSSSPCLGSLCHCRKAASPGYWGHSQWWPWYP